MRKYKDKKNVSSVSDATREKWVETKIVEILEESHSLSLNSVVFLL